MEAYADAGLNMRDYIHRQTTERFAKCDNGMRLMASPKAMRRS